MSKFVEECRREWKRLGVPNAVAEEMAADLEADLQEAESDGASVEEVLGRGAFDPRSFAASWAAERGVIPPSPVTGNLATKPFMRAAIVLLALVTVIGAVLVIFHRSTEQMVAISPVRAVACRAPYPPPPPGAQHVSVKGGQVPYPGPFGPGPLGPVPSGLCRALTVGPPVASFAEVSGVSWYSVGWTLLTIGIVGIVVSILLRWLWFAPASRARRLGYTEPAAGDLDPSSS